MNRAATEDVRSPVWPVVSRVLAHRPGAERPSTRRSSTILDDWVARDAPRLDADNDGHYDDAGPPIMDALWRPIAEAVMRPVFGDLTGDLDDVRGLGGRRGRVLRRQGPAHAARRPVRGPFHLRYCGNGLAATCRASLWAAVDQAADDLASVAGPRPDGLAQARRHGRGFVPGLIPDTFRATNRPTFQQVLELQHP